jgi:hypothetical protein
MTDKKSEGKSIARPEKSSHPERLELIIVILIAVVSVTAALAAWRTSVVASSGSHASRQGMIDAFKKQAGANEDQRKLYEEAGYAFEYSIYLASVEALEAGNDPTAATLALNMREFVLPALQTLAAPLATEAKYQNPDGSYDLEERRRDLAAETPDLSGLDPQASFDQAARYSSERRLLTSGAIMLVLSLFWLGLAEISGSTLRVICLVVGSSIYIFALTWLLAVEAGFILLS